MYYTEAFKTASYVKLKTSRGLSSLGVDELVTLLVQKVVLLLRGGAGGRGVPVLRLLLDVVDVGALGVPGAGRGPTTLLEAAAAAGGDSAQPRLHLVQLLHHLNDNNANNTGMGWRTDRDIQRERLTHAYIHTVTGQLPVSELTTYFYCIVLLGFLP